MPLQPAFWQKTLHMHILYSKCEITIYFEIKFEYDLWDL